MKPMVFFLFLLLLHAANACSTDEEFRLRGIEPPEEEEEDDGLPEGQCTGKEFYKLISEEIAAELRSKLNQAVKKYQVGCSKDEECIWAPAFSCGDYNCPHLYFNTINVKYKENFYNDLENEVRKKCPCLIANDGFSICPDIIPAPPGCIGSVCQVYTF